MYMRGGGSAIFMARSESTSGLGRGSPLRVTKVASSLPRGDEQTIDRFGPHGAAYAVGLGNRLTTGLQSGYLYSYALVMLLGLVGAASWAIWWSR